METLLTLHSSLRWVVLLAAVLAIVGSVAARRGGAGWASRVGLTYTISLDVQVLLGMILWVVEKQWMGDRFFAYEHPVQMILALGLAHAGKSRERKKGAGAGLWFYVASLVLILLAIPGFIRQV